MKILVLGSVPKDTFINCNNVEFVSMPRQADVVVLSSELRSYFLGTKLGELIEEAYSLEFQYGKPSVVFVNDLKALTQNQQSVQV